MGGGFGGCAGGEARWFGPKASGRSGAAAEEEEERLEGGTWSRAAAGGHGGGGGGGGDRELSRSSTGAGQGYREETEQPAEGDCRAERGYRAGSNYRTESNYPLADDGRPEETGGRHRAESGYRSESGYLAASGNIAESGHRPDTRYRAEGGNRGGTSTGADPASMRHRDERSYGSSSPEASEEKKERAPRPEVSEGRNAAAVGAGEGQSCYTIKKKKRVHSHHRGVNILVGCRSV